MPPPTEALSTEALPTEAAPTEAALQRHWACATVPVMLRTTQGERLRLLFSGAWNHGPGPDFRNARLLRRGGQVLRGDVEIHRRARDWRAHGHHRDPAYLSVVLHLIGGGVEGGVEAEVRRTVQWDAIGSVVAPYRPPPCAFASRRRC